MRAVASIVRPIQVIAIRIVYELVNAPSPRVIYMDTRTQL